MTKEIKTTDKNELTVQQKPSYITEGSRGQEDITIEHLATPFIKIVQGISKEGIEGTPEYIEGAKQGVVFNTISNKIYGKSILFVPAVFNWHYMLSDADRNNGGFYGIFNTRIEAENALLAQVQKKGQAADYKIVDSPNYIGLVLDEDGNADSACIPFSGGHARIAKGFNSLIRKGGGDIFSRVYKLDIILIRPKTGTSPFYSYKISFHGFPSEAIYREAESLFNASQIKESTQLQIEVPAEECPY